MKKIYLLLLSLIAITASAQNENVASMGGEKINISVIDSIVFGEHNEVTVYHNGEASKFDNTVSAIDFQVEKPLVVCNVALNPVISNYHFAFGYGAMMHIRDVLTNDMAISFSTYDRFSAWEENSRLERATYYSYYPWQFYYSAIAQVNNLLKNLKGVKVSDAYHTYMGSLQAWRAMLYLDIAQMYEYKDNEVQSSVNEYGNDIKGLTVPIITEKSTEPQPRATKEQMVAFLTSELNAANSLMPSSSTTVDPSMPGRAVVYGLMARLNLWAGDYAQAASYASKAIAAYGGAPLTMSQALDTKTGFNTLSPWMLGVQQSSTDATVQSGIINWTSWMSNEATFGYAYAGPRLMIDAGMYNKLSDTDWRKRMWKAPEGSTLYGVTEWIDASMSNNLPDYASAKFRPNEGNTNEPEVGSASAYPLMRVEEMYFIKAEAEAQQGNLAEAKTTLTDFMTKYRDAQYNTTASTQSDLINEIIFQKRVELWGEGLSYFDYKRLNMPAARSYVGTNFGWSVLTATPNTTIMPVWMNFLIPIEALDNNTSIAKWGNPDQGTDSLAARVPADFTIEPIQMGSIPLDSITKLKLHTSGSDQLLYTQAECSFSPDFSDSFYAGVYNANDSCISIDALTLNWRLRKYCGKDLSPKEPQLAQARLYLRGVETVTYRGAVKSHSNTVSVDVSSTRYGTYATTFFGKSAITPVEELDYYENTDSVRLFTGSLTEYPFFRFDKAPDGPYFGSHDYNFSKAGMYDKVELTHAFSRLQWESENQEPPTQPLEASIYYKQENHDVVYAQNAPYKLSVKDYDKLFNARAYFIPEGKGGASFSRGSNKTKQYGIENGFKIYIGESCSSASLVSPFHLTCDNPKVKVPSIVEPDSIGFVPAVDVDCSELAYGDTVQVTISIADEDALLGGRKSMTFYISRSGWVNEGAEGTFQDQTFGTSSATVRVKHYVGTNKYRLVAPYDSITGDKANLDFTLNADSTITIPDGTYDLFPSTGYQLYYNAQYYPEYCNVSNDHGLITFNFLVLKDTTLYIGGKFQFNWAKGYPYADKASAKRDVMRPQSKHQGLKPLPRLQMPSQTHELRLAE